MLKKLIFICLCLSFSSLSFSVEYEFKLTPGKVAMNQVIDRVLSEYDVVDFADPSFVTEFNEKIKSLNFTKEEQRLYDEIVLDGLYSVKFNSFEDDNCWRPAYKCYEYHGQLLCIIRQGHKCNKCVCDYRGPVID